MMDYKMKGEDALRAHGIDYCIVRSGGLCGVCGNASASQSAAPIAKLRIDKSRAADPHTPSKMPSTLRRFHILRARHHGRTFDNIAEVCR